MPTYYKYVPVCALSRVQLSMTPWTVAHQAPLSMGFPRQECWSGLPCSTPRGLPDPEIEPASLAFPSLAGRFFTSLPPGKHLSYQRVTLNQWEDSKHIFWIWQWHPTPVLLPGNSHGWRSLVGCSPWRHEESDTTERLHFHFSFSHIEEGNGTPLQCSCLESPRGGGAWWAAVYGVAQNWTRLKWLSSSKHIF